MHPDIERVLALQGEDAVVDGIQARLDAIAPRLAALDRQRRGAEDTLAQARSALTTEEQQLRDLQARVAQHKQLQERNEAQLNTVRSAREAGAAMLQAEQARRFVAQDEATVETITRRIGELRATVAAHDAALAEVVAAQDAERSAIETERQGLEAEVKEARGKREATAREVPKTVLATYERMRKRHRSDVVFPLRGASCANCDTAIPTQRRASMTAKGTLETCEACGMLLYAPA